MAALRRINKLTVLLSLGSLGLAVAIAHGLVRQADPAPVVTDLPAAVTSLPELAPIEPFSLPEPDRFAAIVERPLFSETRRPPTPPPPPEPKVATATAVPAAPAQPRVELGQFKLAGIVEHEGVRYALIRHVEDEALQRVIVGQEIRDWRIEEIALDSIVLSHQGVRDVVMLRDNESTEPTGRKKLLKAAAKEGKKAGKREAGSKIEMFVRALRSEGGKKKVKGVQVLGAPAQMGQQDLGQGMAGQGFGDGSGGGEWTQPPTP